MSLEKPFFSDSAKTAPTERFEVKRMRALNAVASEFGLSFEDLSRLTIKSNDDKGETISGTRGSETLFITRGSDGISGVAGSHSMPENEAQEMYSI